VNYFSRMRCSLTYSAAHSSKEVTSVSALSKICALKHRLSVIVHLETKPCRSSAQRTAEYACVEHARMSTVQVPANCRCVQRPVFARERGPQLRDA